MLRSAIFSLPIAVATALAPLHAQAQDAQITLPQTGLAETAPELRAVFLEFGLYDILQIMSAEGIASAAGMEADMFPQRGGAAWQAVVAGIYASDRLIEDFEAAVSVNDVTPEVLADLEAFVRSDLGQRIVAGEVAARRAFLDPGVEDSAREMVEEAAETGDPRLEQYRRFIEINDLLERNVSGALNANFAFYRGLVDGNGLDVDMPESLMLSEVWGQEPELRADMVEWLYSYQFTAYSGLSEDDMDRYIAFGESEAGRVLNAQLFTAFEVVFERVSYELGTAAAGFMTGEDT